MPNELGNVYETGSYRIFTVVDFRFQIEAKDMTLIIELNIKMLF